ncbi:hypothetical protein [Nonomuraea fuscirosea]|uniref:hypothetical protein n=1 Tax=Nonomuraea fuscirosea TaxID=1291556 RepID=UPI0034287EAF
MARTPNSGSAGAWLEAPRVRVICVQVVRISSPRRSRASWMSSPTCSGLTSSRSGDGHPLQGMGLHSEERL